MNVLLVVYDNDSYISWFPQGLAYIATVLRKSRHNITIYNQDVYHWPESHLTDFINKNHFDVVGIGVIAGYYQYRKLLEISEAINKTVNRPFYVIGGHGPSPEPEYFLHKTKADAVVIGEGEITIVELLQVIECKQSLSSVKGIAYIDGKKCVKTEARPLIKNMDTIDYPSWDLFPMDHYTLLRSFPHIKNNERCLPVLSGRGCPFKCNFCYRMDKGFRPRSIENILEEISILQKNYNVSTIEFSDELLMSSEKRTIEICEGILSFGKKFKWGCNGRLNFAKTHVLKLMKRAGCVFINYGIESLDQKALNTMNKALTVKMIYDGIENTLAADISPGYNIIFGNICETEKSLQSGVKFLLKYSNHAQMRTIRPVTPYPGSPLYYYAIEKGLLKDCEDFYENKHLNSDLLAINFTKMSDSKFHEALLNANTQLITDYFKNVSKNVIKRAKELYLEKDVTFRGFR